MWRTAGFWRPGENLSDQFVSSAMVYNALRRSLTDSANRREFYLEHGIGYGRRLRTCEQNAATTSLQQTRAVHPGKRHAQ